MEIVKHTIKKALRNIDMPVLNGVKTTNKILDEHLIVKELMDAVKKAISDQKYSSIQISITLLENDSAKMIPEKNNSESDNLTSRESEILKLIVQGLSSKEIGEKLFISMRTVDTHRAHLMDKLRVKNVAGLICYALKNGYLDLLDTYQMDKDKN